MSVIANEINNPLEKISLLKEYQLLIAQAWDLKQLDHSESDFLEYQALQILHKIKFLFS
ncbi:hypothetical protein SAMN04488096_109145 [Mesonia phycicola]|uniref:Uncharacterized protein n=1 Tax=Mesonia phycicola TaxID=579105 RepID=A0A1M6H5X8_9FLAO|nr:hypothetical protein [Mesonia phycicola]SHJ17618.1 hypothetical protein SAMN04488096_109145 [Mesonia phycicola]